MPGVLWLSADQVAAGMSRTVTARDKAALDVRTLWGIRPYANLQVGDPYPLNRSVASKIGRRFRALKRAFLDAPESLLGGIVQFSLGFALGRWSGLSLVSESQRQLFYLGTTVALGPSDSYLLGGMHMGMMTSMPRGSPLPLREGGKLKRAISREVQKQVGKRFTESRRFQMPDVPGMPGTEFIAPLLSAGMYIGSAVAGAGIAWLLGGDTSSPPPASGPTSVTSIKPSAAKYVAPFSAWVQTGSGLWGIFGAGMLLGRILSDKADILD